MRCPVLHGHLPPPAGPRGCGGESAATESRSGDLETEHSAGGPRGESVPTAVWRLGEGAPCSQKPRWGGRGFQVRGTARAEAEGGLMAHGSWGPDWSLYAIEARGGGGRHDTPADLTAAGAPVTDPAAAGPAQDHAQRNPSWRFGGGRRGPHGGQPTPIPRTDAMPPRPPRDLGPDHVSPSACLHHQLSFGAWKPGRLGSRPLSWYRQF